ncbi:putative mitochondrial intermediate peptidase [Cucumis melo var. makuwa]|uniref:Putative mitochondrial intermediate peptidase n=1 Tax=Cucumis melo var. makuwa TaxID=1194695 RepID=A0A5D3DJ80_CUCMM|nr:putative mitochondrial intermediate peptidase [Cucumis melo var. makuwa]
MSSLVRKTTGKLTSGLVLKSSYWNCSRFRSIHAPASAPQKGAATGLYGFDHLKSPQGFRRFVDEAIERSGELVTFISSMPSSAEVIQAMDEISNSVCSVFDSAELCRQTHPDSAVKKAEHETHLLTREAHMAAHYLRVDFERAGIHLSADKLDRVNQLNIEISQLCQEFKENIVIDPGYVDIFPPLRMPNNLYHLAKPIYRSNKLLGSRSSKEENGFRLMTDSDSLSSILQFASDDEVRKMAYVKGNSSPRANLGVLDKLIATRHSLAQDLCNLPQACVNQTGFFLFLSILLACSFTLPFDYVKWNAQRLLGDRGPHQPSKNISEAQQGACYFFHLHNLWIYDKLEIPTNALAFCFTLLMQILGYRSFAEFAVTPNLASSPAVVMSFLQELSKVVRSRADECIEGLKTLVKSLFGASFYNIPLAPGESWHPDVLKLSLQHPEEGELGFLYLDLYSRKGKYPGCAHFAIKGGRKVSETEYQLPVVALVCNFSSSNDRSNVRLNHSEVETLFHEFGHALHSLLSRTEYQHFSGTRVVLDLAETPSNLFEYYASDYRVLKTFAKHYSTGEIIPEKLVKSMQGAKMMFAATELQRQILYALIDQTLFGEKLTSERGTASVVADLKRQYTSWKHVDGTHWQSQFCHLLTYGADNEDPILGYVSGRIQHSFIHILGYYTYLYAKCFAATIWEKLCKEDPLSRETGNALRTKFLEHGGSKEPVDLLTDLVGDGIIRYREGGVIPDITSLCKEMGLTKNL